MAFGNLFTGVKKAKKGSNYKPRLPMGQHTVLLKKYGPKATSKEDSAVGGHFIESSWLIAATNSTDPKEGCKEGDTRDWPWFIQAPSWQGSFARQNAQQCIEAIMKSIDLAELPRNVDGFVLNPVTGQVCVDNDPESPTYKQPLKEHDVASIGELASDGFFRGIQLGCSVEPSFNKKEKKFRVDKEGKPYGDAAWKPVLGQTLASIAEMRAGLDQLDPPDTKAESKAAEQPTQNTGGYSVPVTQTATAPTAPPTAPATPPAMSPALQAMLAKAKAGK